jgi:hypothetical protein
VIVPAVDVTFTLTVTCCPWIAGLGNADPDAMMIGE